ncbi:hypothetical protein AZE42_01519 [Rhizopogon vesiculosus]|uniref:CN hydrolase domain-containing protein n=1 Tax=Rhizopogon vesiculosus TaxID=180088 RepID=A0A1J8QGF9_9AGAM|nr:hypothetical protein AZE42_01519 [Rhizopogon vesiculosus]
MTSCVAPVFNPFTLTLVQLGSTGSDKAANLQHAHEMVMKAAKSGSGTKPQVIVLPECFNSPYGYVHFPTYAENIGYTPGEEYDIQTSVSESVKMLSSAAKEAGVWLVGGSIPERDEETNKVYNTCTVYSPTGALVALHRKVHLFDIDIPGKITFKVRHFYPALALPALIVSAGERDAHWRRYNKLFRHWYEPRRLIALHSIKHSPEFARIGLGICYDVRFQELAMISARQGCHVVVYPGAFNLTTGPLHWELLQRARAVDNQIFFSMCSPARDMTAGYHAWGHSMVVDPYGKVLVEADESEMIVHANIDPEPLQSVRAGIPVTKQRRFDVYPNVSAGK